MIDSYDARTLLWNVAAVGDQKLLEDLMNTLGASDDDDVRGVVEYEGSMFLEAIARNPNTSADVLTTMARDPQFIVRECVAGNPNTPTEALTHLAQDEYEDVRANVSMNSNTPADVLIALAGDESDDAALATTGNPNIPVEAIAVLATSEYDFRRNAAASCPKAPAAILIGLCVDESADVQLSAVANPNTSAAGLLAAFNEAVRSGTLDELLALTLLARRVDLPETELSALVAESGDLAGRIVAWRYPVTSGSALHRQLTTLGLGAILERRA